MQHDKVIIGIDPGTNIMGYGILGIKGKNPELIALGVVKLNKYDSHYLRLLHIHQRVLGLVEQFLPDEMAIEAPFSVKMFNPCSSLAELREWLSLPRSHVTYLLRNMNREKSKWP